MMGAIVGDIVGSVYEWHNTKTRISPYSVMTVSLRMIP